GGDRRGLGSFCRGGGGALPVVVERWGARAPGSFPPADAPRRGQRTRIMRPREIARSIALFAARTPTLPPATHTNSYALGAREVLLVEPATPFADEQRAWIEWARSLEAEGRRLVAVVATHHHPDHVGGADALLRALGVPLWAHAETAARIATPVARRLEDGDTLVLDGPVTD